MHLNGLFVCSIFVICFCYGRCVSDFAFQNRISLTLFRSFYLLINTNGFISFWYQPIFGDQCDSTKIWSLFLLLLFNFIFFQSIHLTEAENNNNNSIHKFVVVELSKFKWTKSSVSNRKSIDMETDTNFGPKWIFPKKKRDSIHWLYKFVEWKSMH